MPNNCPFCPPSKERLLLERPLALAFLDGFPVSEGHTLVIARRHIAGLFDLLTEEREAVWSLVAEVRQILAEKYRVQSFNIGLNDGQPAGQTVGHAHVHVIPRRDGDVPDPRGGVRWIIPDRAKYWK